MVLLYKPQSDSSFLVKERGGGLSSNFIQEPNFRLSFGFRRREDDEAVDAEPDALAAAVVVEVFRHQQRVRLLDDPENVLHGLLD